MKKNDRKWDLIWDVLSEQIVSNAILRHHTEWLVVSLEISDGIRTMFAEAVDALDEPGKKGGGEALHPTPSPTLPTENISVDLTE